MTLSVKMLGDLGNVGEKRGGVDEWMDGGRRRWASAEVSEGWML